MFEAFKIGVRISMMSNAASVLGLMSTQLHGVHGQIGGVNGQFTQLEKTLAKIKGQALIGGALLGAGAIGISMLKGPYEEAKKLAQAQTDFKTLNLTPDENNLAFSKAATMSHKILGTTITGNVKLIHDLHTAFGDLHHAIDTADMFAKFSFVAKVANGGKAVDGLSNAAAKALEHRGGKVVNDPKAFETELNMMEQVMLGTKMRVSPQDYLTASGTGKMAYQMYDKEYLYGNYAGLMSINGGARTGTEGMTTFSSLIGGHMDAKAKGFLTDIGMYQEGFSKKRLGLMNDSMAGLNPQEKQVAIASMGGQAVLSGGLSDADAELLAHRPDLFIPKMVAKVRERFGFNLTDEQIALMTAKNFNRSTGNFLGTQITMAQKLGKDSAIVGKTMTGHEGYQHYLKSPEGAEEAAGAAWTGFLTMFGAVYLPVITRGLLTLAGALDSMGQWVSEHSTLTKGFVYLFGILSAAALAGGGILLATAGVTALTTALTAVGGVIGIIGGVGLAGALGGLSVAIGSISLPVIAGIAALFIGMGLMTKVKGGPALSNGGLEDFYAGRGNQSSRYYGLNSKAGGGRGAINPGQEVEKKPFQSMLPQSFVPAQSKWMAINNTIVMPNGEVLAKHVTRVQARELGRPPTGPRNFDGGMSPRPVGSGG